MSQYEICFHLITGQCDILKSPDLLALIWETPTCRPPVASSEGLLQLTSLPSPTYLPHRCYSRNTPQEICHMQTSTFRVISRKSNLGLRTGGGSRNNSIMGLGGDQRWVSKAPGILQQCNCSLPWRSIGWWWKECTEGCYYLSHLRSTGIYWL